MLKVRKGRWLLAVLLSLIILVIGYVSFVYFVAWQTSATVTLLPIRDWVFVDAYSFRATNISRMYPAFHKRKLGMFELTSVSLEGNIYEK